MNVQDLIDELKKLPPHSPVEAKVLVSHNGMHWTQKDSVKEVRQVSPSEVCPVVLICE